MSEKFLWPAELSQHFQRLSPSQREQLNLRLFEMREKNEQDYLLTFMAAVQELAEQEEDFLKDTEFKFLLAHTYFLKADYKRLLEICEEDSTHPGLLNLKALTLINQKKFEEVESLLQQAEEAATKTDPYNKLFSHANRMLCYYYSQQFEKLILEQKNFDDLYLQLKNNFSEEKDLLLALTDLHVLGSSVMINYFRREGRIEESIALGEKLISLLLENNNRFYLNRIYNNTALCYVESGRLKEGLQYLEKAFQFSTILSNDLRLAIAANNIGFIYRFMGNIEKAMHYFKLSLEKSEKANVAPYIIASQTNIAHLYLDFGQANLALEQSELALEELEKSEVPIPPQITIALNFCRADIFETLDKFTEAKDILNETSEIINETKLAKEQSKVFLRLGRIAARQSNLGEAKRYLEETIQTAFQNQNFEVIVNAKLQLAEIDLLRYRMTGDDKLLMDTLEKLEDIKKLCLEQDYKLILIDVYILQSLLLTLKNKKRQAKKILESAIQLAGELGVKEKEAEARSQLKEIEREKKNVLVRIFTRINQSIRSTIAFESITKPKEVKTKVKALFIIIKNSGLPLFQKHFATEEEGENIDPNLLSGLLSAIQTIGQTILNAPSEDGQLKLIDHGNISIMLESNEKCLIALIVSRETYLLREKLREFSKKLLNEPFYQKVDYSIIKKDDVRDKLIEKLIQETILS